jgi:hypothetical protein
VDLANLGSESETCVGGLIRLVRVPISFEKKFYRLPFTPPLSGSPYRSFNVVEPFCLTLRSRQFWIILSRLCRAVALVLGDRDFSHSSDLFLAFVWLLITCLSFSFLSFLFLFSLNWLLVCVCRCFRPATYKGEYPK